MMLMSWMVYLPLSVTILLVVKTVVTLAISVAIYWVYGKDLAKLLRRTVDKGAPKVAAPVNPEP